MSYVSDIRKIVGHFPLQLPGTGIILWRMTNYYDIEILLQERKESGKYGLLGGGIEFGETYKECALREIEEEAGIVIPESDLELFDVYAGPNHVTVKPNGDVVHHTVVTYSAFYEGEIDPSKYQMSETGGLKWFNTNELHTMLMRDAEEYFFHNNIPILWDVVRKFY